MIEYRADSGAANAERAIPRIVALRMFMVVVFGAGGLRCTVHACTVPGTSLSRKFAIDPGGLNDKFQPNKRTQNLKNEHVLGMSEALAS